MTHTLDPIARLLDEAQGLENGPSKVALLEEAVRLADMHGDIDQGFQIRQDLMQAASFGDRPDLLLVAFSWCLAQCDRNPEHFDETDLLWKYKWVVTSLTNFPEVNRQQIAGMLADMKKRFRRAGSTLQAVYHKRREVLKEMGDFTAARRAHQQMAKFSPDWLSDCPACRLDEELHFLFLLGQDEEAVNRAAPIFQGRLRCAEVPHRTLGNILLPLVRLGRLEEAMRYHRQGYRLVAGNPEFLAVSAHHLIFLCLTDNLGKAIKVFEKHLPDALVTPSLKKRFDFYLAALFLLERLADQQKDVLHLRLPASFPLRNNDASYATRTLLGWFEDQLNDLAGRFNARNGNRYYSRRITELKKWKKWVAPFPLSARDR